MSDKKIRIGKITKAHGLKGEFKVYPYTDDEQTFVGYKKIYIEGINEPFNVKNSRPANGMYICKLAGYDKIEDIEKFLNKFIFIDYEDKRKMAKDEFLIGDLIGLEVFNGDKYIGKVDDVLSYPVNDVIKVLDDYTKEILIPNVKEFVISIDLEKNIMQVKLIEGM
ncbi:MAG: 16S rRNA processing protein RimM [Peptostreptococcaceae bacterium]|nr:16S rRNA processing protein RimM [Peptostreptococcaceae bacterium]